MLTADRLRELLRYDPQTGIWIWLVAAHKGRWKAGRIAGSVQNNGYRVIRIDGHLYQSSRLAFLYMTGAWPEAEVDHRDTYPTNDSWDNLRPATRKENNRNTRISRNNRSGFKGVFWHKGTRKWRARLMTNGKIVELGLFASKRVAHAAYCEAAREHFGEFARFH